MIALGSRSTFLRMNRCRSASVQRQLALAGLLLVVPPLSAPASAQTLPQRVDEGGGALIYPGDVVRLTVFPGEDLTGEFPVNQFGSVVLPLVGEYEVRAETHMSLREKVIRAFRDRLVDPSVELIVLKRVRVLGQVNEPGVLNLDPTMTVADALAMARGTAPSAHEGIVQLRRGGETLVADLRVETPIFDSRIRSGDEIFVPARSWLDRNTSAVLGFAGGLLGVAVALIAR